MSKHTEHSSYREKLIEHLFIGELLKISWFEGDCDLEVAKPEVDNSGYDVILEAKSIVRHVQLKASYLGAKTSSQKLNIKLGEKPSGCILWIQFDEDTLELGPFFYFGNDAGEPLLGIDDLAVAKHTKANSEGEKAERPNIRVVKKAYFEKIDSIHHVYERLFRSAVGRALVSEQVAEENSQVFQKLNRIKLWSGRPHQHNHHIIKAFLDLSNDGLSVSYMDFKENCERIYGLEHFDGHLNSMMTDAGNSHGKVFYREGDSVFLWPRVKVEIEKYFVS